MDSIVIKINNYYYPFNCEFSGNALLLRDRSTVGSRQCYLFCLFVLLFLFVFDFCLLFLDCFVVVAAIFLFISFRYLFYFILFVLLFLGDLLD